MHPIVLRRRRFRHPVIVGLVVLLALSLASVAVAQSSAGFDLACRGTFDSAGAHRVADGGGLALVDAAGQPVAGMSTSANYGVRAGVIQPFTRRGQAAAPATDGQTTLYLPFIYRFGWIIRNCNW